MAATGMRAHAGETAQGNAAQSPRAFAAAAVARESAAKEAGKMRAEGKGYIVKDGDVMHFLFNT